MYFCASPPPFKFILLPCTEQMRLLTCLFAFVNAQHVLAFTRRLPVGDGAAESDRHVSSAESLRLDGDPNDLFWLSEPVNARLNNRQSDNILSPLESEILERYSDLQFPILRSLEVSRMTPIDMVGVWKGQTYDTQQTLRFHAMLLEFANPWPEMPLFEVPGLVDLIAGYVGALPRYLSLDEVNALSTTDKLLYATEMLKVLMAEWGTAEGWTQLEDYKPLEMSEGMHLHVCMVYEIILQLEGREDYMRMHKLRRIWIKFVLQDAIRPLLMDYSVKCKEMEREDMLELIAQLPDGEEKSDRSHVLRYIILERDMREYITEFDARDIYHSNTGKFGARDIWQSNTGIKYPVMPLFN
jgi:hypothetical protein